jgi:hypothetical protein
MSNPRWTVAVILGAVVSFLLPATAFAQQDKKPERKVEQMKENGVFTAETPKDKVKTDCPGKLYTLNMVPGRTYIIELKSEDFDAFLRLEDPNGKTIKDDDDSGGGPKGTDARIIFKADKAGTYTIAATSYNQGAKGKYTLLVGHDGVGTEQEVKNLLDVKAKLTKEDAKDKDRGGSCYCKTFKVDLAAKTTYVIQLDSRDFDAFLRLVDPDGKEVASDDDGAKDGLNAKITYNCTRDGSYTIVATSYAFPDTGDFHLHMYAKK